ncbi:ATP-binding protein [Candidatus Woesearchaeota archaeon]|nr:ATP-binding protein [Candidatus Woesearchaeota archaeon]
MDYLTRTLEATLHRYLTTREIIAVVGPRQCGKTTLLRHLFEGLKKAVFLDFEDRQLLQLFSEDIKAFAKLYVEPNDYVFIDEFQYATAGGKQLKYLYDTYKIKIIISGSSVSELSIQSIKYLTGRIFVFQLYPFSFTEFLQCREPQLSSMIDQGKALSSPLIEKIFPYFEEFCVYGGYPRTILAKSHEEKETVLANIYNTYFLKEVKEILNIAEDYKLARLLKALALQMGGIVNYKELTDVTGYNYPELLRYVNILEKTFICRRSMPFYTNKRLELAKAPKIYFMDNGFRNATLKEFQPLDNRQDKGALYENFVASECIKAGIDLKYWRTKAKAEVDFIVEKGSTIIPIEIKSSLQKPELTRSYWSFLEKYKPEKGFVLSEKLTAKRKTISFRPIFQIGMVLEGL